MKNVHIKMLAIFIYEKRYEGRRKQIQIFQNNFSEHSTPIFWIFNKNIKRLVKYTEKQKDETLKIYQKKKHFTF